MVCEEVGFKRDGASFAGRLRTVRNQAGGEKSGEKDGKTTKRGETGYFFSSSSVAVFFTVILLLVVLR